MPTQPLPVRYAAKPDAAPPQAPRRKSRPSGKTAAGDTGDSDPKTPPKKIMSASGAFFLTPGPAKPKRP